MIRKIVESSGVEFSINPETGDMEIFHKGYEFTIPSEDATDLLIELRKQQLDYLQKKQDQEEGMITRLIKSICR